MKNSKVKPLKKKHLEKSKGGEIPPCTPSGLPGSNIPKDEILEELLDMNNPLKKKEYAD